MSRSRTTGPARFEGVWRRFLPLFTRCGGDNGGSCLPCARSHPMRHIETCRHPRRHPRPARLRAVGAAALGECLAMVRDVSPTASPLLRHVSTQVGRDGQPALCRRPRAAAIRRPSPRNSSPHLHRRGRRLPLACSPQPAPRAVRCAPRGDVRRIPMSFRPVWARTPGRVGLAPVRRR